MALLLHPLNTGFCWSLPAAPPQTLDAAQIRAWNERGHLRLTDVFGPDEIDAVIRAIDPIEARVAELVRRHPDRKIFIAEDGNITFSPHLVTHSPVLREFCAHPAFCDLARDLIGPDVRLYWDQAVYKKPERPRSFPWHQDNGYTYIEPQQYLTCWVALTDATVDNGCPWVAPGLHRSGTLAHEPTDAGWRCLESDPADATPIELSPGGVAVFSSLTPHRTGPNRSDGVRKAYIVQFAPDGAAVVADDGSRVAQDAPDRQFRVLRGGERCEPPAADGSRSARR